MNYRKLPIAWSVAWGVVAVSLCVLWMRSYYLADLATWRISGWRGVQFTSTNGQLTTNYTELDGAGFDGPRKWPEWVWSTTTAGTMFEKQPSVWGFDFRNFPHFFVFPYWVLVVSCIGLGALPATRAHVTWRFSLRTLLVVATVVAVLLGVVVIILKGS